MDVYDGNLPWAVSFIGLAIYVAIMMLIYAKTLAPRLREFDSQKEKSKEVKSGSESNSE